MTRTDVDMAVWPEILNVAPDESCWCGYREPFDGTKEYIRLTPELKVLIEAVKVMVDYEKHFEKTARAIGVVEANGRRNTINRVLREREFAFARFLAAGEETHNADQ